MKACTSMVQRNLVRGCVSRLPRGLYPLVRDKPQLSACGVGLCLDSRQVRRIFVCLKQSKFHLYALGIGHGLICWQGYSPYTI